MSGGSPDRARIDYWLWCVRVFKTRQLAKHACLAGHVTIDWKKAKPASPISVGQTVSAVTPGGRKIFEVLAIPASRVSAPDSAAFAKDHTPPEPRGPGGTPQSVGVRRERGLGRPTKKDRRAIDQWRQGGAYGADDE